MVDIYSLRVSTGNARDEQIRECLDAGFDDVAIKPYQIAPVIGIIDRLLGSHVSSPLQTSFLASEHTEQH